MTRSPLRLLLLCAFALAACGGHDGLTANGQVAASDATGNLGAFNFATDTKLYLDEATPPAGVTAGHCTITRGTAGMPDKLDFGLMRTGVAAGDLGLSQLRVAIDDARPTSTHGVVTAVFGQTDTYASVIGSGCSVTLDYDAQAKAASFTLGACTVAGSAGARTLTGSLQYYECDVR